MGGSASGINWRSVLVWLAGIAGPAALAVAGWAHSTLWCHDTRLTTLEVHRESNGQQFRDHVERDGKTLDQIRDSLRRMEDKMDRWQERNSK
jgi:hypothetical protein